MSLLSSDLLRGSRLLTRSRVWSLGHLVETMLPGTASIWTSVVAPILTFVAAVVAVASAGWAEGRRLRSRHRFEERHKLQSLIGEYRGRMLEAAVDWDRRMVQLYRSREDAERDPNNPDGVSQIERYLEDDGFGNPDPVIRIYGKYCRPREYLFRSYIYRLVALAAIARKFESQAFYIDSKFAHAEDFEFLKFSKAFLWALTTSDLPDDSFPGQDHIPNDELRPILDSCYRATANGDPPAAWEDGGSAVFDLPRLDLLIASERQAVEERLKEGTPPHAASQVESETAGEAPAPEPPDDDYTPEGFGKVLQLINGLRKPKPTDDDPRRLIWDRLCALHLLTMAFIDEFGYDWQAHTRSDLKQAVGHITDKRTLSGLKDALDSPLALLPTRERKPLSHAKLDQRTTAAVRELLGERLTHES